MRTIPVDLILHELAARLAELPDPQHRDLHLAISGGCIRPQTLAEEWIHGAGVAQSAAWLVRRLDGDIGKPSVLFVTTGPRGTVVPTGQEVAAETRSMEVAVARRLADCALSLLVTQDAEDAATAQTLLQAAQRVVGLPAAKPGAEAAPLTNATDGADDGLAPATLRHYLAATRDALGLGSGPVFLGDIVTRAKSLAKSCAKLAFEIDEWRYWAVTHGVQDQPDVDSVTLRNTITKRLMMLAIDAKARRAAEAENANKASIIAKQEKIIANLTRERDVEREEVAARGELLKRANEGQRLKVVRDCLPPGVDIIVCLHDDKSTTYKPSNIGEEYGAPEAAVRAAWVYHQRPTQSVPDRAFKVGDRVWFKPQTKRGEHPTQGEEGHIDRYDDSDPRLPFRVKWDAFSDFTTWHRPEDLALVTPTA